MDALTANLGPWQATISITLEICLIVSIIVLYILNLLPFPLLLVLLAGVCCTHIWITVIMRRHLNQIYEDEVVEDSDDLEFCCC